MANQMSTAELLAVNCGNVSYKGGVWSFYWGNSPMSEKLYGRIITWKIFQSVWLKTGSICKREGKEWESGNVVVDHQNQNKQPVFGVVEEWEEEVARTKWDILQ